MTELHPAVLSALNKYDIRYTVLPCDDSLSDTAAFCDAYGYTLDQSANTIIVASRKTEPQVFAACVVVANSKLDVNKAVCKALGIKRASFADGPTTIKLTSMQIGGVVAIGLPADMPILIDTHVLDRTTVIMGGGNRTSKLVVDPHELLKLPNAKVSDISVLN